MSRVSAFGIVTWLRAALPRVRIPAGVRPVLVLPSLLFSGYRGYFSGVKRPVREAHHSPSSRAAVKKKWRCSFTVTWTGGTLPFNNLLNKLQHVKYGKENLILPRFLVFGRRVF